MKKYLILGLTLFISVVVFGEKIPPANWGYILDKQEVNVGDVVEVIFKANVPKGYHIYSNDYGDCPPIKAKFVWEKNASYELIGGAKPIGSHHYTDEIFECEVADFEGKAEFRQKVKILSNNPAISGVLEYQMCTDDGMCVLFEYDYTVKGLKVNGEPAGKIKTDPKIDIVPKTKEGLIKQDKSTDVEGVDAVNTGETTSDLQINEAATVNNTGESAENLIGFTKYAGLVDAATADYMSYQASSENDTSACLQKTFNGEESKDSQSFWGLFIVAFLSGLAALLTPCVFPMIPMTVSFFMKDGSKAKARKNGIIYGLSIIAIYVLIGTLAAVLLGPAFANWLSTHWLPNLIFFLVFVIFAASFFGAFEIVLPSWIVNKADAQADKGGLTGIFFMAFTIVLVSFSCTGPIVGSILVESAGGAFVKPLVGMLGFSLAFAIPFALFAIFPSWLSSLPKSGGWLNSVKVVLGFLELALGLKFLSVADQTYHWGILDREIYIGLWIVIFLLMGLYLLGKLKFSHDSDIPYLKVPRLFLAIATFAFVVYLVPGLIGAPLKGLAGYLPPLSTHDFNIVDNILNPDKTTKGYAGIKPKYNETLHLPDGLRGYFDYEQGMEVARKIGRPVLLDFTGHGCVNCREVEARVWTDSRVHKLLDEEYVVVSLYADEKKLDLPIEEHFYKKGGKKVTTLDKKNLWIQDCYFSENAQPLYVLLDNEGNMLQPKQNYEFSIIKENYISFLEAGLEEYSNRMEAKLAAK